ncbi:MAG: hypothetical protein A2898_04475 [Candidatus Kerfeldbacteria bacterium RIFCSPLOWO2_01_FULL_48_11]|uniref:Nudix hydrolase domain-containing protein n=1 Tax=Candidatus Kerfeldbacteria bacterium RIFCSPLOWO2_01_FULL_48_11 TaxID=1798543 RepID=A0A1G2B0U5_9BACT|nr:MAG: NUDIX hydrolase [Parcubacteria group bacterium GW2011_GWA2_48_9]KKW16615.1 MAG: NUDIX hydrolase [Parcubacteria group bacterium GW2011_GWC2_49_9]OGY82821.1 MAG: hypothetical protein A2898_04475 [Candidatus Kerfeldbacteria bacterium RIFCSPLOWO2_01_FULL_48_11]HCJ52451.1 hypothetical protein [Candidatus Kerfeldbacteria bacterium]HCM68223.1 hypothetical protein [Candidatus Kerfeldbacteria bacterium]
MEPKLFVATKAFIIYREKVLIVRESHSYADGTNAGKFDVVGGRMHPGTRFDENLKREVKEETGLDIAVGLPFFVNEWYPKVRGEQWQIIGMFFSCRAQGAKVLLSSDHVDYLWIQPTDYAKYPLIENLVPAFKAFIEL